MIGILYRGIVFTGIAWFCWYERHESTFAMYYQATLTII